MKNDSSSLTNTSSLFSTKINKKSISRKRKIIVLGGPGVGIFQFLVYL